MGMEKITEQQATSSVKDAASIVITQPETLGDQQVESVRRAPLAAFAAKIAASLGADVKTIEAVDGVLVVTHMDGTQTEIEFTAEAGQAFDAITYDQETGLLHITLDGQDVVDPCSIPMGSGAPAVDTTITITNRLPSLNFTVPDTAATIPILYAVTSVDIETGDSTGDVTESWYINGNRVRLATVAQGNRDFDAKPYCVAGAQNTAKLVIEDSHGNSKPKTWTINCASYSLAWNLEEFGHHNGDSVNVRLTPSGQGSKTVKVSVDGTEIFSQAVSTSGRSVAVTVPAQAHGAHTILAWMTYTVDGVTMTSEILRHVGIWTAIGNTTPIVAVYQNTIASTRFAASTIKYRVFNPASETATASLSFGGTNTTVTVDRSTQSWTIRPTTAGQASASITCGLASAGVTLNVADIDYDITPVTRGIAMLLDPSGHTNAEANRTSFGYTDGAGVNHPLTFSNNFDWVSGGFQTDSQGVSAFVVKRGTRITFDRSIFADNAKASGKEFKIVFKVTESRDYDAEILSCKADNIGLKINAQQATLSSALKSMTTKFCEEKKIELDVNIDSITEDKLAVIWLEGVPARAFPYDAEDNWQQTSPELLTIGSDDCDVWIYGIRLYTTSLTRFEIRDNWIADCGIPEEMVNRYERNDIFNANGTINEGKLSRVKPELRVIHIWADRMTTSKSDTVTCNVTLVYQNGGAEYEFTAEGVTMKAQGTSSLEYILAALNLDLDFSTATLWQNGNGEDIVGYAMTANSIPVNYVTLKVNVASSENANNVCMADDYNAFQPYVGAARTANSKVRDTIEGHPCAIFFTNTAATAITVGSRTVQPGETILYAAGDICNSKKNYAVFGQNSSTYPQQCCVEITNNNNLQCRFKSADLSHETWDGEPGSNFEFRYPKNPTAAHKEAWRQVLAWVVSTDLTAATDEALSESVSYGGVTYAADTVAYRAAKFKNELAEHFAVPSLLYHLLTTGRRLMPDNRAKNVFFSYEWDETAQRYLWNACKNYDDDTLSGNDNSGGLTFDYGMEDTDMVGAASVFNASDSVLWCNLRDLFVDELGVMFRQLEAAGAWSSTRILAKWKAYRDTRPEGLIVEDMWNKYFAPYIYADEERYIRAMLGTKEDQLQQFETYQEPYWSAKYDGSLATADRISMRTNAPEGEWAGVEPSGDIEDIVPYASTYIAVKYGNAGTVKLRAVKGQSYDVEMPAGANLNDLETYIYSASNIASIGSLAGLYPKFTDISSAKKLQQMLLGSGETGYANTSLSSENGGVSFGNNTLMKKIDLRGAPNLAQGLNLTALKALEEIYTTGSGITGVTFAQRAPVHVAQLNALRQLIARDLTALTTFSMPTTNLQTVWIENCPIIDTKALVTAATGLTRGRLIGVNWQLDNASLLLRLAALAGLDGTGQNTTRFVLTGAAHVTMLSADDITTITTAFPELTLTYDTEIPMFTVVFKAANGTTTLNSQRVAQGSAPQDPTQLVTNPIATPTKASTAAQTFTFDGWAWSLDGAAIADLSAVSITANTVLYAHFTAATRHYTVRWYNGNTLLETQTAEYGECVDYSGDIPVNPSEGDYALYYLFSGWDKSTGFVSEDLDVYARYAQATVPSGKTLAQLSPVELHALIATGVLSPTGANNDVVASGDSLSIVAGRDFDFSNVDSHELVTLASPQTFDGTTYLKPQIDSEDILLFDAAKSFTLAIDFAFDTSCASGGCLASCYQSNGFLLRYSSGGSVRYGASNAQQASADGARQMVVIRKNKGDPKLYVYASNKNESDILYAAISQANAPSHDAPLCFGAQMSNDAYLDNYAKGTIFWAKLWDDDLGDTVCRQLAQWPRETWGMKAAGNSERAFRNFLRADVDSERYVNLCLHMTELLEETHKMNATGTNAGGWKDCAMRTWLNARIIKALPLQWQQLVLPVYVKSTSGGGNNNYTISDPPAVDKIWLPSSKEVNTNVTGNGYADESDAPFTIYTNDASRIKKLNFGTGAASGWWLRSPGPSIGNGFMYVTASGSSNGNFATVAYGVAFGFCI